jgi:hypothetical protein
MKRTITAICFASFLIFGVFAYTQEPSENKPRPQEEQKPESVPEQAKPPKHEESTRPEEPKASKPEKEKHEQQQPSKEEAKPSRDEHEMSPAQARQGHPSKSNHIPDEKFRASFGRQHTFVINRPVMVENRPRFQSGGIWFEVIDPWPADWAFTDECFIDFIDGEYFLVDVLHPNERVVVFVAAE